MDPISLKKILRRSLFLTGAVLQVISPELASLPESAWHKIVYRLSITEIVPREISDLFQGPPIFEQGQFSIPLHNTLIGESDEKYLPDRYEISESYRKGQKPFGRSTHRRIDGKTFWIRKEKAQTLLLQNISLVDEQKRDILIKIVHDIAYEYKDSYNNAQDKMHNFDDFVYRWAKLNDVLQKATNDNLNNGN